MFSFFKKNKGILPEELGMLSRVFLKLPKEYDFLREQFQAGMLQGAMRGAKHIENYVGFGYNPTISKKFIDERGSYFRIKGIILSNGSENCELSIYVSLGLLMGYSMSKKNDNLSSFTIINVENLKREFFQNEDYEKIKKIFSGREKELVNSSEVYEVILEKKSYYHIKDIGDGDFIGINSKKEIFRITHDPFCIEKLEGTLMDYL